MSALLAALVLGADALTADLHRAAAKLPAPAKVGIAVLDLQDGRRWSVNGDVPFPMQSVVKLPVSMAMLDLVDRGKFGLDQAVSLTPKDRSVQHAPLNAKIGTKGTRISVRELIRAANQDSDNTANDVLLRLVGGPKGVSTYLSRIGVRGMRVDRSERQLQADYHNVSFATDLLEADRYQNYLARQPLARRVSGRDRFLKDPRDRTTPNAAVDLLSRLASRRALSVESTGALMEILFGVQTGRNRLAAGLPEGSRLAHKTGTAYPVDGRTGAVNDIGIAVLPNGRRFAIAVFVTGARGTTAEWETVHAEAMRAAVRVYSDAGNSLEGNSTRS